MLAELEQGSDGLPNWAHEVFGEAGFADINGADVIHAYGNILSWVTAQPQFLPQAVSEFQAVADGWLVAYAVAKKCVVVTLEEYDPGCRRKVKLPNVGHAFGIDSITPFELLSRLKVKLTWMP